MALDAVRSTLRKLEQTSKARNLGAIGLTPTLVRYQRRAHDELIEAQYCVEDDILDVPGVKGAEVTDRTSGGGGTSGGTSGGTPEVRRAGKI